MESLHDQEFGTIRLRRMAASRHVRLRVRHDGSISITLPKRVAIRHAKDLVEQSRPSLRRLLRQRGPAKQWQHGDKIGASHRLVLVKDPAAVACRTSIHGDTAIVRHHPDTDTNELQARIHDFVVKLLRKQAAAYIPRRLAALARDFGFEYARVRYSNAETRWGSCSSGGTISVNIWLMNIPLELVDYVLLHELAHTRHMNHGSDFWQTVEDCLPSYKQLRRQLKQYSPTP